MDIEELSNEWIKAEESTDESDEENHWSIDYIIDLPLIGHYDELWAFIKQTYKKGMSNKVVGALAAGPLEDLLADAGETYIDEIEELAKEDPKFSYLLGGVWKSDMTEEVWERVQRVWDSGAWDGS